MSAIQVNPTGGKVLANLSLSVTNVSKALCTLTVDDNSKFTTKLKLSKTENQHFQLSLPDAIKAGTGNQLRLNATVKMRNGSPGSFLFAVEIFQDGVLLGKGTSSTFINEAMGAADPIIFTFIKKF